jgi:hypothetical protein
MTIEKDSAKIWLRQCNTGRVRLSGQTGTPDEIEIETNKTRQNLILSPIHANRYMTYLGLTSKLSLT